MSIKIYAVLFGILFLAIGILGSMPQFSAGGQLLGMLTVNPAYNLFSLITGVLALFAACSAHYARRYFKVVGIIYLFIALLAFLVGSNFVYVHLNHTDNLFHLIVGAIFLYLGFGKPGRKNSPPVTPAPKEQE